MSDRLGTYCKRKMRIVFNLGAYVGNDGKVVTPTFTESGTDTVVVEGVRASAAIRNAGGTFMTDMHLRIFGLNMSLMNQLSTLGLLPMGNRKNTVTVETGDDVDGMAVAFKGDLINAWANFQAMPDVSFEVISLSGAYAANNPVPASSWQGAVKAEDVLADIARRMGRTFTNYGVSVVLSNPVYPGTLLDQMQACVIEAGVDFEDDGVGIVIWPRGSARRIGVLSVSKETGLVGYPAFISNGVAITMLHNPQIRRGSMINLQTELTPACGTWAVYNVSHELSTEAPNGPWFTYLEATVPGNAPT
jgi:hypothetical protein